MKPGQIVWVCGPTRGVPLRGVPLHGVPLHAETKTNRPKEPVPLLVKADASADIIADADDSSATSSKLNTSGFNTST